MCYDYSSFIRLQKSSQEHILIKINNYSLRIIIKKSLKNVQKFLRNWGGLLFEYISTKQCCYPSKYASFGNNEGTCGGNRNWKHITWK